MFRRITLKLWKLSLLDSCFNFKRVANKVVCPMKLITEGKITFCNIVLSKKNLSRYRSEKVHCKITIVTS